MTSLFDIIAFEDTTNQATSRKAVVLANHRVDQRLGGFVKAAKSSDERQARLALVQDDLESIVAGVVREIGSGDPAKIVAQIRERLAASCPCGAKDVCDCGGERVAKTASVHEARRPKMCPYHAEVVDISLAQGEPQSGFNAMAQHAWSEHHCAGGWEGKCNFKPAMTTQTFWDERKEQAEQRRQEREEQRQREQEQQVQPEQEAQETVEAPDGPATDVLEDTPDNVVELPLEGVTEPQEAVSEAEVPMAMAASADDRSPLDGTSRSKTAELEKLAPGKKHLPGASPKRNRQYEHIKESCLEDGKSEEECKELAARTVNKQRAEHGETKSHVRSIHAAIKEGEDFTSLDEWNAHGFDDEQQANPECPACGGPGVPLGQLGARSHFRCRNCGFDFSDTEGYDEARPTDRIPTRGPEPGYHGYASVQAAEAQGDQLGTVKRVRVDEGSDTPIPKIDKRKWTPENVSELDVDSKDGPHPTKRKDILESERVRDTKKLDEIGEQVTEHQDVTKDSPDIVGDGTSTFPSSGQADAVTSAKLVDDVDKNPIQALIEGDYDGFPPEAEVQRAIQAHRS